MDENKLRKLCELALDTSFSGVTISEFCALPTQKWDSEKDEWVPDSYSIFVVLKKPLPYDSNYTGVESFLESLLGFECCVDLIS